MFGIWALLHQRDVIGLTSNISARSSYPLLPWPGVMLLGYLIGVYFTDNVDSAKRRSFLLKAGVGLIILFTILRLTNTYGDSPWASGEHWYITAMSFLALTKYPPSLLFLLSTLGVGALLLALFEHKRLSNYLNVLVNFGSAPMFFYIVHLYVIRLGYLAVFVIVGANQGKYFGFDSLIYLWLVFVIVMPPLYYLTRWFGRLKQRRKDIRWLKYF